jgi:hypothetical protein
MFVQTDFIMNGEGRGEFGSALAEMRFDPGLLRPYFDAQGNKVCTIRTGRRVPVKNAQGDFVRNEDGTTKYINERQAVLIRDLIANDVHSPVFNATTLSKDQWIQMDNRVIKVARKRLRAYSDLRAANTFSVDGMATSVLEHETITDDGEAIVDMEGVNEGRGDESVYQLQGIPLPITHSSFYYSRRKLMTAPQLSFIRAEQAARRVAETIENTYIGNQVGMTYGNSTDYGGTSKVYGLTNYPDRITKTNLTASSSFVGKTFVDEVIAMRELAYAQNFFGPFMMYVSTAYDAKLDEDYKATEASSTQTVRSRLREIDGIQDVRRLDYLSGDVVLLVQMTSDVVEAINGMELTTVQWESMGGMKLNFKVMAIQVPSIKSTADAVTGIVHGTTS